MSIYHLNKILYRTDNDAEFRKRMKVDPHGAVEEFPLSGGELEALVTGDMGALYRMGGHTFF